MMIAGHFPELPPTPAANPNYRMPERLIPAEPPPIRPRRVMSLEQRRAQSRPVEQLRDDGTFVARFESMKDASAATGVHYASISEVVHKRRERARGFRWRYASIVVVVTEAT